VASKKVFMCFSANLGRRFLKSSNAGHHFSADYQGCCHDFQQIKTFGVRLHPQPPTSNTTAFHKSIIGNFVVYQDRLEHMVIAAFRASRKLRLIYYNFCYYFWGPHRWWIETNIIGNEFFVFYKFPLPQTVLLLLLPSGETSTLGQGGQIAVVGARVKTVKYMTSSCSFNLGTTFQQHSFPYKLRPNPRLPALC